MSLLSFMGVPPERLDEALALVESHLSRFGAGSGEYDYPLAFWIVEAVAPTA